MIRKPEKLINVTRPYLPDKKKAASKKPRIAFISALDVKDRKSYSGVTYHLSALLNKHLGDVKALDRLRPKKFTFSFFLKNLHREIALIIIIEYAKNFFLRILKKKYNWGTSLRVARYYAKQLKKRLENTNFDLIWAEKASTEIAFLETEIPIIYESDATFALMIDYYPDFSNLAQKDLDNGNSLEKSALDKARFFVATTQWVADAAVNFYGQDKRKIAVIPHPPNLDWLPAKELVLRKKTRDACNLLFVGVDWQRKGGDIAVDAVNWLNQNGIKSFLTICGCELPKKYQKNKHVRSIGFLNKSLEKDKNLLNDLYLKTHFLVLPTRAETQGQVFCEAAAYAIPVIATNTGGIPSVVKDQQSGVLLGMDAKGSDYGREIKLLWEHEEKYALMRNWARQFYEENLSADKWVASVKELIQKVT